MSSAPDGRIWRQYFADYYAGLDEEIEIPDVVTTIERQRLDADPALAGSYVRKAVKMVEGWPNSQLNVSLVRVSDEFRLADSIKKPGQEAPEHRKGELKKAAHRRVHWWLSASFPALRLGFQAHWEQKRGRTARSAPAFSFSEAVCADPLGMPTEFFVDYQLSAADVKQKKDEPGWAHAERVARLEQAALARDRAYNDGLSWLNRRPVFRSYKDFEQWLKEANEMVAQATQRKEAA